METHDLASVIQPSVLEGDLTSPVQNNDLTDERKQKEALLFDQFRVLIKDVYWKDAQFNGLKMKKKVKKCLKNEAPYDNYDRIHKVRYNFKCLNFKCKQMPKKQYFCPPISDIHWTYLGFLRLEDAMTEYCFMAKHIICISNEVIFIKCSDPVC